MKVFKIGFVLVVFIFSSYIHPAFAKSTVQDNRSKPGHIKKARRLEIKKAQAAETKLRPAENAVRVTPGPGRTESNR